MICGVANDSTVTVAPIFWAFLGIGFAINQMAEKSIAGDALKNKAKGNGKNTRDKAKNSQNQEKSKS